MATKQVMGFDDAYSHILDVDVYPKGNDGNDGADGVSIVGITVDNNRHIICAMSDGTTIDAGAIPVSAETGLEVRIVQTLPNPGTASVLYCVPTEDPTTDNAYDEYMWINNDWERIGSAQIDLSGYYTSTEVDTIIDRVDNDIEALDTKIDNKTNSLTVKTTKANSENTYYLIGTSETTTTEETELYNSRVSADNTGVKYVGGSALEEGKLYIDEERVTTGLFYTIS